MKSNKIIRVNEIIRNHLIDGCVYTAYSLDNQAMLYIKEITDADILANVSDKLKASICQQFKEWKDDDPEMLNGWLENTYKSILGKLTNDYLIYTDDMGNVSKYKAQMSRNCYVNIKHPITGNYLNINNLVANLKNGYLTIKEKRKRCVGDHIDQNKYNNSFENIRLITQKENSKNKGNKYVFIRVFEQMV